MQSFTVKEAQANLPELLKHSQGEEPLVIADESGPVALLVRLPRGLRVSSFPANSELFPSEADSSVAQEGQPVFGSCKGMLTIISEDEEHLKDFEEYMK
jgi:antitoxin (DNA-binding transcriptional repressor) of toxin-antitoxin stability system